jgi:hypothetical protein
MSITLNLPTFQPRPRKRTQPRAVASLDDWQGFMRWLQAQPLDRYIGFSGCADSCPLHSWLVWQGAGYVRVHSTVYTVGRSAARGPWTQRELPAWALAFRREIDRWVRPHREPVTVLRCLEALRDVVAVEAA